MANDDEMAYLFAIQNQQNQINFQPNPRTVNNNIINSFELTDSAFIKNYRLTKNLANSLIQELSPFLKSPKRSSDLDVSTKVLVALNFFATGSYQTPVGNSRFTSVSQSSVSRCIEEVTSALNTDDVFGKWVKFPSSLRELRKVRNEFYETTGIQGCIGCIDCTHVAIVPPIKDPLNAHSEYIYVNRKGYHSINVQLICDSKLRILNVNALFPGSTNDSYIWNNCDILPILEQIYRNGQQGYFLLGDSGYALRPWLLTPINDPVTDVEQYYNKIQMTTRSAVERCNGVLKMRFRCLLKHRFLHYHPEKCTKIINACTVLHNMCIIHNVELPVEEGPTNIEMGIIQHSNHQNNGQHFGGNDLLLGRQTRSVVANYLYRNRRH
ncbi:putative nuclease HARBI1 [Acyrthosiphon pisum]|uniref:DDE Tnp4 domain-containing protein n=1 Tax=Acyrthosiphon pisum TaxID=7029 RepID=A0A8R1WXH3_ACYPI|nr:putative nuclease HARBI1 [Acyrthosiphon pisum]|eukprot:XP_008178178.1 PREDICTED: putative nuclease HARBI1 [Acyrthosiphon pisum]